MGGIKVMEYRRCQGKSYMLRESEIKKTGYQIPMLRENQIKGILPMQKMQEGEGSRLWYDISGKHDLEGYARFHKLGKDFLENFILSLYRVSRNLGEYLLLEDELCLDPEMIYLNYNEKEISFCYVPGNEKNLETSLGNFMEFFLKHMEHGEQKEIEVCYKVYEKCQGEHINLSELAELVAGGYCRGENDDDVGESENAGGKTTVFQDKDKEPDKKRDKHLFRGKGCLEEKKLFLDLIINKKRKDRQDKRQFVFQPEEDAEETSNPTVFLGSEQKEILGELRYEGEGRGKNFKIDVPVFLVGSQEGEANGVIFTASVSRQHALIYKEEENFFIEDLNSTNGTYLNGEALGYKEKVPLSKNDKIKFADEAYRFV